VIGEELLDVVAPLVDRRRALPAEVEARARWLVLDSLGCAIAGGRSPNVRSWLARHGLTDDPYGTADDGSGAADAGPAMALAMGACWDEACEGHAVAHGRPGIAALAAIWPSVLEMTLAELLRAVVVGYEVGARMGAALRISPGMHVDANWPSLGAAAAAACALGLDPPGVVGAVGIAACQLPVSLYRPVETGDTARNTYLGHAAVLGRMAAQSSAVGITAPRDAVESYARVAYGRTSVAVAADARSVGILSGYFKEYAAVRHVHYAARAAAELRTEVPPEQIRSVEVWTYPEAMTYCGIRDPRTPLQAQFSLSFGVAAMLRWGRLDPMVYRTPQFQDPLVRSLERNVVIHQESDGTDHRTARVQLVRNDGRTTETTASAVRGDASMPWSQELLTDKFLAYCQGTLSPQRAGALAEHLLRAPLSDKVFPPG
jgi:2-methylcitrate dehydratase PrpD